MVPFAQRLPIASVPEQLWIAPVRDDMVDDGRRRHRSLIPAHAAERVLGQEQAPRLVPTSIVAALSGTSPLRVGGSIPGALAFLRREGVARSMTRRSGRHGDVARKKLTVGCCG
jgi:hypothetical protein